MMPFGPSAAASSAEILNWTISEYTWHSRTRRAMTWVYCEPKSRMTTRECVDSAILIADTGFFANDGVRASVRLIKRSLPGHSALQLDWHRRLLRGHVSLATRENH